MQSPINDNLWVRNCVDLKSYFAYLYFLLQVLFLKG